MGVTLLPIVFSVSWLVKHFLLFYDNCYFFSVTLSSGGNGIENGWMDYHYLEVSWLTCLISSKTPSAKLAYWKNYRDWLLPLCQQGGMSSWLPPSPTAPSRWRMGSYWPLGCTCTGTAPTAQASVPSSTGVYPSTGCTTPAHLTAISLHPAESHHIIGLK